MNATDLIKTALPWIGTALGGPLGTGVASFVASQLGTTPDKIADTLTNMLGNPADLEKAKELDLQYKDHCMTLGYQNIEAIETINAQVVGDVNVTMQAETKSDHWLTYSWRPLIGISFGLYISSMWVLPLCHVQPVLLTTDAMMAVGGILGIASYFRGKAQADPNVPFDNRG